VRFGGAPGTGLFGRLFVGGSANLDGTLVLTPVNGYTPQPGDAYAFLSYGGRRGDFGNPPPGFTLEYDDVTGVLTAVAQ
jgi:hypothetical protein